MATTLERLAGGGHAFPSGITNPSRRSAMASKAVAATALKLLSPGGTGVEKGLPQKANLPSALTARLKSPPAAIEITLDKPAGTLVAPELARPQAVTVPS